MTVVRRDRDVPAPPMSVVAFAPREPARAHFRTTFPRRRARLVIARTAAELEACFRRTLVDVVVLDVSHATDETWRAAALARAFPSAPFYGLTPYRASDAAAIARCASFDFADVLADGVDDAVLRDVVLHASFSARFAHTLLVPPASLGLGTPLQRNAWRMVVAHAGRTVRTERLARALGLTREHLSRRFATEGAPNLKRVVDLVRLLAAAELAKNPGYDIADVAAVLEFASASHLATTTQRVAGTRPASLARLRAIDLIKRFTEGRGRSRTTSGD